MIRLATVDDIPAITELVRRLARLERLESECTTTEDDLRTHLFGPRPYAEVFLAEDKSRVIGFASFFHSFSTFLGRPGLHLEDLYVLPQERGRGWGKALFVAVARVAMERGCGRLEWRVLHWNEHAIAFYQGYRADLMDQWRTFRMTGVRLRDLAETPAPVPA
ncbi:MAG TPA: GNAT family N-acetyltransferase [Polyangiaceae bacterium]|jgi:GNAT superfamily N-acetyltransferase|nr:GNAT family N-acetyltransferase [Polyangiaceae bacterium]